MATLDPFLVALDDHLSVVLLSNVLTSALPLPLQAAVLAKRQRTRLYGEGPVTVVWLV